MGAGGGWWGQHDNYFPLAFPPEAARVQPALLLCGELRVRLRVSLHPSHLHVLSRRSDRIGTPPRKNCSHPCQSFTHFGYSANCCTSQASVFEPLPHLPPPSTHPPTPSSLPDLRPPIAPFHHTFPSAPTGGNIKLRTKTTTGDTLGLFFSARLTAHNLFTGDGAAPKGQSDS